MKTFKNGNMSLIGLVIALVVVSGGIIWYSNQKTTLAPTKADAAKIATTSPAKETNSGETADNDGDEIRVINVKGSPFKFEPSEIRMKKGETVTIVFTNEKGMHDWVVNEFNARTKIINGGETDTVQLTADKVGTFEFYCSVGNHRAMGMRGNLIVE